MIKHEKSHGRKHPMSKKQKIIISIIAVVILIGASGFMIWFLWLRTNDREMIFVEAEWSEQTEPIYSRLTGLEISDERLNTDRKSVV